MAAMGSRAKILVAEDLVEARETLLLLLSSKGFDVTGVGSGDEVLAVLRAEAVDALVLDIDMPGKNGLDTLQEIKSDEELKYLPTVMLTAHNEVESIQRAFDLGADDYVTKPYQAGEIVARVRGALAKKRLYAELADAVTETKRLRKALGITKGAPALPTKSKQFAAVVTLVDKVAGSDLPVLITGESGTGKELVAQAVHYRSSRCDGPLVIANCAALSEQLLESELFGHVKGAFTGALKDKIGLFEAAHGGTLFLDELGEMPLSLQAKVLRAVQQGTFMPVGSTTERTVDVRIVAATNKDLKKAIAEKQFREDLYYRLSTVVIALPPLRERPEDILDLAQLFLSRVASRTRKALHVLDTQAQGLLLQYQWPGNIRQLQNEIERACIMAGTAEKITMDCFSDELLQGSSGVALIPPPAGVVVAAAPASSNLKSAVETLEHQMIEEALRKALGNKSEAARALGISRSSLLMKIKEYALVAWDGADS